MENVVHSPKVLLFSQNGDVRGDDDDTGEESALLSGFGNTDHNPSAMSDKEWAFARPFLGREVYHQGRLMAEAAGRKAAIDAETRRLQGT